VSRAAVKKKRAADGSHTIETEKEVWFFMKN
jgi:hypothetical protein